jgi:outer membrane protein assembly factor BamB
VRHGFDSGRAWRTGVVVLVLLCAAVACGPAAAYDTPVQPGSPWPTMRHDRWNAAASPIVGRYRGARPWAFATGKGIFSTPIAGADGTIYFGSADTWFYAVGPDGKQRWRFKTGDLIDSAGFIGRYDRRLRTTPLVVPSGDTYLYKIRGEAGVKDGQRVIWKYTPPEVPPSPGQQPQPNWWEGNAEPGPDGTIYAGNTGDAAYAINPGGTLKWVYRSLGAFWTDPAIADDGTTYWGSLDLQVHALDRNGKDVWRDPTLGFVISSPALDRKTGTLYVGSFDSNLYALDARTGAIEWKFQTGDHIYSSPALDLDAAGSVRTIFIASTDGQVYALDPHGNLRWSYDAGDVIRSSPVLGTAADGVHRVLYVGAGNGTLYALNASNGTRRWSYDTTRDDPVLRDRNDLNASPALTQTGVAIGGEDGYLKFVPYDYCLHRRDARCNTAPGGTFGPDVSRVFAVTSGGNTQLDDATQEIGSAAVLPLRLVVRNGNQTVDASMQPLPSAADLVSIDPPVPFTAQLSGDGHYLFLVPDGALTPGQDYSVRVHGNYTAGGLAIGNARVGGTQAGSFDQTLRYHVAPAQGSVQLSVGADRVSALHLTRLAFPLPSFATSVNQIGFDAYDLIVGVLATGPPDGSGRTPVVMWAIGARPATNGMQEVDPQTTLGFPLGGTVSGDALSLSAKNVTLTFSFGPVPVQRMELRAQLTNDLVARPGADIYGEVDCATVPTYGPVLPTQRLCNDQGKLIANGTFVTSAYDRAGTANQRPPGVSLGDLSVQRPTPLTAGEATATLNLAPGAHYPAKSHFVSIVLTDAITGAPAGLDYKANTTNVADSGGDIAEARLTIPAGTTMPARVRAYVVTDVFPLATKDL